jgi:hypothetical protein
VFHRKYLLVFSFFTSSTSTRQLDPSGHTPLLPFPHPLIRFGNPGHSSLTSGASGCHPIMWLCGLINSPSELIVSSFPARSDPDHRLLHTTNPSPLLPGAQPVVTCAHTHRSSLRSPPSTCSRATFTARLGYQLPRVPTSPTLPTTPRSSGADPTAPQHRATRTLCGSSPPPLSLPRTPCGRP